MWDGRQAEYEARHWQQQRREPAAEAARQEQKRSKGDGSRPAGAKVAGKRQTVTKRKAETAKAGSKKRAAA